MMILIKTSLFTGTSFCRWFCEIYSSLINFANSVYMWTILVTIFKIICILIAVAYFTLAERKVMASIQRRRGPNIVGFWGLLQPIADGVKLIIKELVVPSRSNPRIFVLAPLFILTLSFVSWSVIPFGLTEILEKSANGYTLYKNSSRIPHILSFEDLLQWLPYFNEYNKVTKIIQWWPNFNEYSTVANISYGVLFILAISSLNVYGIILAGWASNSKYAFLGALRSAAQMISYEVSLGLVILPVIMLSGSLNLTEIVVAQQRTGWYIFPLLPCSVIFIISMIAETNRAPFDLPEAEAELVAGYNVEYSSFTFAMFFLGEYSNMLLMATIATILFLGGWYAPFEFLFFVPTSIIFSIKIIFFCFLYVLVRATLPRYRYDQLMDIGWKIFLPITFGYLILIAGILVTFDAAIFNLEVHLPKYTENILHTIFEKDILDINFDGIVNKRVEKEDPRITEARIFWNRSLLFYNFDFDFIMTLRNLLIENRKSDYIRIVPWGWRERIEQMIELINWFIGDAVYIEPKGSKGKLLDFADWVKSFERPKVDKQNGVKLKPTALVFECRVNDKYLPGIDPYPTSDSFERCYKATVASHGHKPKPVDNIRAY